MRLVAGAIRSAENRRIRSSLSNPADIPFGLRLTAIGCEHILANSRRERRITGGDGIPAERLARFLGQSSQRIFPEEREAPSHRARPAAACGGRTSAPECA